MFVNLEHVEKTYISGEVTTKALHDVTLEIDKGEFLVVLGPSEFNSKTWS